ncbi:MAG TPA: hypothetical protein PKB11_02915 [Desulfovibrio sp.]|jgi:hypothetical protein|uniref:hypothetical protein n=1 Tax=Desulfovibrio TaxID=872 RepID=UPI0012EC8EE5|nr:MULTISPECIES: hypothetical protein [Desulfovibrio]HMM37687.1 hypothetical protein [Desulfovibrio sp.]
MNTEFLKTFQAARESSRRLRRMVYLIRWNGQIVHSFRRPTQPGCEVLLRVAPWTRLEDVPDRVLSMNS